MGGRFSGRWENDARLKISGILLQTTAKMTSWVVSNEKVKKKCLVSIRQRKTVFYGLVAYLGNEIGGRFSGRCKNDARQNISGTLLKRATKVKSCVVWNEKVKKKCLVSIRQRKTVFYGLVAYLGNEIGGRFSGRCKNDARQNISGTLLKRATKVKSCVVWNEKVK